MTPQQEADEKKKIAEARLLLDYATRTGEKIDDQIVESIISYERKVDTSEKPSQEDERSFIGAFSSISRMVHPVTYFSIEAIEEQTREVKFLWFFPRSKTYSRAGNMQRFYRWSLVLLLLFSITLQGIVIFGNSAVSAYGNFEELTSKYNTLVSAGIVEESQLRELGEINDKLEEHIVQYSAFWRANYAVFYKPLQNVILGEEPFEDGTATEEDKKDPSYISPKEDITALVFTRLWLNTITATIIPLLYGLLGANTFILRQLSRDIENYSLQRNARIMYGLRLSIGGISGLAVGLFINPSTFSDVVATLSPAALAFLAGYSSELLFSALDQLVAAFSREPRTVSHAR